MVENSCLLIANLFDKLPLSEKTYSINIKNQILKIHTAFALV